MPQQPVAAPSSQQIQLNAANTEQPTGSASPVQPAKKPNPNSTQNTLLISEIREGLVIMKDGTFRAGVACKSINFDLMSRREREGVEYRY